MICRNVPIARTGEMEYLGEEIGLDGEEAKKIIKVNRSENEVFSEAALASFEGKPVTNDHPPVLIDPDNAGSYENGHAQNIRRGSGEWADYIIADLHIHNRALIDAIQNGKREVSCGYECEYIDNGDGTYSQKKIRGNHIAVVERGRAGKRAAILDSYINEARKPERKKMKKNGLLLKLFGQAAQGKSQEEIEQLVMDAAEMLDEGETETKPKETKKPKEGEKGKTEDELDINEIIKAVTQQVMEKINQGKQEKDPIDAAIEELEGKEEVQEETKVIPAEEMDKGKAPCGMDRSLATAILKKMRPAVASIKDENQRKAVADAIIACVTDTDSQSDITKIIQASQDNARAAADRKTSKDIDTIQAAYDSRKPHKNGGK